MTVDDRLPARRDDSGRDRRRQQNSPPAPVTTRIRCSEPSKSSNASTELAPNRRTGSRSCAPGRSMISHRTWSRSSTHSQLTARTVDRCQASVTVQGWASTRFVSTNQTATDIVIVVDRVHCDRRGGGMGDLLGVTVTPVQPYAARKEYLCPGCRARSRRGPSIWSWCPTTTPTCAGTGTTAAGTRSCDAGCWRSDQASRR